MFVNYAKDDKGAEEFVETRKELRNYFKIIKCELSSYGNVKAFVKEILDTATCIDCFVLNSAVIDTSPFKEIIKGKWEYIMNTNVNVTFSIIQ